jgi:hypothetical protein
MVPELLTVGGVTTLLVLILTILFQYAPGLRTQWAGVKREVKMVSVLGAYFVIGAIVAFGGCIALLAALIPQLQCVAPLTFFQYAFACAMAVGAGQGIFGLMPELGDVQATKDARLT